MANPIGFSANSIRFVINPIGLATNPIGFTANSTGFVINPIGLATNPIGFAANSIGFASEKACLRARDGGETDYRLLI